MSKPSSRELFVLIKSLTKSEKRYFKMLSAKFSENSKENKYLLLFDAIEKQKEYDENKIREEEPAITNLPKLKERLYDSIMKSLRMYHSSSFVEAEVRDMMNDIKILYNKGLYLQCKRAIEKALAFARHYELHTYIIELYDWRLSISRALSFAGIEKKDLMPVYDEVRQALKRAENNIFYEQLYFRLSWCLGKYGGLRKNEKEKMEMERIVNHPMLASDKKVMSSSGKASFHLIHGIYHSQVTGNDNKSFFHLKRLSEFLESKPERIVLKPMQYINTLSGLLIVYSRFRDNKNLEAVLDKLKNVYNIYPLKKTEDVEGRIFGIRIMIELDYYINCGRFEKIKDVIEYIEEGFRKFDSIIMMQNRIATYFNASYMYFAIGEYRKSLSWLNKIPQTETLHYENLRYFFKLLNLIIHYELGNTELLPYLTRSTYRFLYKREKLSKFDKAMLHVIQKLFRINSQKQLKAVFIAFRDELDIIFKAPLEKQILDHFDFMSWVKSKIENRPFIEIVKEKFKNQ